MIIHEHVILQLNAIKIESIRRSFSWLSYAKICYDWPRYFESTKSALRRGFWRNQATVQSSLKIMEELSGPMIEVGMPEGGWDGLRIFSIAGLHIHHMSPVGSVGKPQAARSFQHPDVKGPAPHGDGLVIRTMSWGRCSQSGDRRV